MEGSEAIVRTGRKVCKIGVWTIAVVIALIASLIVVFLTFDWNRLRPWVDEKVSQAIGRQFEITGDLEIGWRRPVNQAGLRQWALWPRFSATKIKIANPSWAKQKDFATLDEIDFQVEILPLIMHNIVIPSINLVSPSVVLERLRDNRNNWTFKFKQSYSPSVWNLQLHDIVSQKGYIAYADEITNADIHVVVNTLGHPIPLGDVMKQQEEAASRSSPKAPDETGASRPANRAGAVPASQLPATTAESMLPSATAGVPGPASTRASSSTGGMSGRPPSAPPFSIGWTVNGRYNNIAVAGAGKIGGVLALQDAARPFPVQADLHIGDTRVAFVGTLTDPAHLAALDLRLWLQGISLEHLYALTGISLPPTPPYSTEGRLVGQFREGGNVFKYENFTGRVGGSDLNGSLVFVVRWPRPLLSGELASNLLQFSDLAPVIGADSNVSKARRGQTQKQPPQKTLPTEQFRTDRWTAIDADVKFNGQRIIKDPALPVSNLYAHLAMKDGVLSFEPLNFGVAGGTLSSTIHLDGSTVPLKGRFATSARHLKLRQLLPTVKTMQSALGEVNGDAALSATGNSPAALAATLNGEVKTLVNDGTISRLYMEAAGLNVANTVYEKLFGSRDVKINCAAADFVATNGVLESRVFALDTEDAVIGMDGTVNLKTEEMNLNIHPHTKGFRIFSLRSPLYVRGTFKNPHVGVEAGALAARGAAAVGMGLLNPFAALVPLIAPSNNKPLPCTPMPAEMRKAHSPQPPGKR
jgi:AsmA family protein